jgi:hypothetical protein
MGKINEAVMPDKFPVGQRVQLAANRFDRVPLSGNFEIVARLPSDQGERQYRIKHDGEAFERRVGEYRLSPVF